MMKNNPESEARFLRILGPRAVGDYGIAMSEDELRQCASGRKLLADLFKQQRAQKKACFYPRKMGLSAAASIERKIIKIIKENA